MDQYCFLVEEFKENWAYIRHIELLRHRMYQLYLTITAAVVTATVAILNLAKPADNARVVLSIPIEAENAIVYVSCFISAYGYLLCAFVLRQKHSYERYRHFNPVMLLKGPRRRGATRSGSPGRNRTCIYRLGGGRSIH